MSSRLLVIAAGGTGGHMFPAEALSEEMLDRGWRVCLTSDERGLRFAGGFPDAVERVALKSATLSRGGLLAKLATPATILSGTLAAWRRFRSDPPDCVVGFGGYPSLPALSAAWMMNLPRMIHEQNGVLGRVNRVFATRVDRVACGTWPVRNAPEGARLVNVGNPVRKAVLDAGAVDYVAPGGGEFRLLVFGGSQGASVFARLVPRAVSMLPGDLRGRIHLTQQVRPGEDAIVAETYHAAGVMAELSTFFDDMPRRIAESQLVIARAGASTIAELAVIGRPAILVPYPAALDDHQTANARMLVDTGAAILIPEADLTAEAMAQQIAALLTNPDDCARMADTAHKVGQPDAASALADLVVELGKQPTGC